MTAQLAGAVDSSLPGGVATVRGGETTQPENREMRKEEIKIKVTYSF